MANTDLHTKVQYQIQAKETEKYFSPRLFLSSYAYPNAVADSALEIFQKSYDVLITAPREGVITIYGPGDGTIQKVSIWASIQTGSAIFNVELNGSNLFSGGSRPQIDFTGDPFIITTGLNEAIEFGDYIELDVEQVPAGGISRLVFQIDVLMD